MQTTRLDLTAAPAARPDAEPNVTPLIDVLLVLLVIFMLAQAVRQGMDAQLPPPGPVGPVPHHTPIVLQLPAEGGWAVNRQPVPASQLDVQLRAILDGRRARVVFVDAAPERSYRDVVAAMDLARGAGAQVVGLVPAGVPRPAP
jgi:biopolymer transport protein ExbD